MILLKTGAEIERMATAGSVVGEAHRAVQAAVAPGVTTAELDELVRDVVLREGGTPLFLDYRGFPAHSCISVNEEVVHGVPGDRVLQSGDILTVDIGVRRDDYCADSARIFYVDEPEPLGRQVTEGCRAALAAGIEQMQPGAMLSAVSGAIEKASLERDLTVIRRYVGHGIGREMHESPQVPNFLAPNWEEHDVELVPGLVLAVEPMLTTGEEGVSILDDGWTVVMQDGALAAHCEHSIAVTEEGPRVLTLAPGESYAGDLAVPGMVGGR